MNEKLTIQDLAKLTPLIVIGLALLKLLLLPFCLWVFGKMLELCKSKLKEIIDELYKEQIAANAITRSTAKDNKDDIDSMSRILSGMTESMRELNALPKMVENFNATMVEVNKSLVDVQKEMSYWRGKNEAAAKK